MERNNIRIVRVGNTVRAEYTLKRNPIYREREEGREFELVIPKDVLKAVEWEYGFLDIHFDRPIDIFEYVEDDPLLPLRKKLAGMATLNVEEADISQLERFLKEEYEMDIIYPA